MTPAAPPNAVVRFVQALAPAPGGPDGDLLARYLDARDEAAFAELVRRHGGMVVAVCRRVLADPADADDAAQTAFLVLVRRAHSFTRHATVGDFLHGVALRTALKLRTRRARRHAVEAAAARPEATPPAPADDVREQVDRAVRALPAKLRDAVVLCELEGVPRLDAAARLGILPGTLASRLAAARTKLARRLGPVAPALLATLPAESARAAGVIVPIVAGAIPAAVKLLATEVTRMLVFHKLKVLLAGAAVAVGATGAGVALTRPATADDPKPAAKADAPPKPPAADAKKPANEARRLKLDADDIAQAAFLDVYKYEVRLPKGPHRLVLRETPLPKVEFRLNHTFNFEVTKDEPVTVLLSFIRRDRQFAGFLGGTDKEATFRFDYTGGANGGVTTIVPLPLADLSPTKRFIIHRPDAEYAKRLGVNGVLLLASEEVTQDRRRPGRHADVFVEPDTSEQDAVEAALGGLPEFKTQYEDVMRTRAQLTKTEEVAARPDTPAVLADREAVRRAEEAFRAATAAARPKVEERLRAERQAREARPRR